MEEIVRLNPECIPCLLRGQLERYPKEADYETKMEYMQKVLRLIADAPKEVSAPILVREIGKIQREMFGNAVDYSELKKYYNQLMMEKEAFVQRRLEQAEDPVKLAVQYAIVGNFIDFGAMDSVDEQKLETFLNGAESVELDEMRYQKLRQDIRSAKELVYLTDNCGEIVMDKLLVKTLQRRYPKLKITVIVRGAPVLNDATMEDAIQVGLHQEVEVIGNGNDIAGTCIAELSEEARRRLDSADVILAKGQGNFETMQHCGRNVYYIFMCKCEMFARLFQVPQFTGMLLNDKEL